MQHIQKMRHLLNYICQDTLPLNNVICSARYLTLLPAQMLSAVSLWRKRINGLEAQHGICVADCVTSHPDELERFVASCWRFDVIDREPSKLTQSARQALSFLTGM